MKLEVGKHEMKTKEAIEQSGFDKDAWRNAQAALKQTEGV